MGAAILNKPIEESNLKLMKNNRTTDKIVINTMLPKFEYKNNKGEIVKPNTKSLF